MRLVRKVLESDWVKINAVKEYEKNKGYVNFFDIAKTFQKNGYYKGSSAADLAYRVQMAWRRYILARRRENT